MFSTFSSTADQVSELPFCEVVVWYLPFTYLLLGYCLNYKLMLTRSLILLISFASLVLTINKTQSIFHLTC